MRLRAEARTFGPIYLPIETLVREFDSKMLLATAGLARGYSIVIGRKGKVARTATRIRRGIYFNKDHGEPAGRELFPRLAENDLQCTALDEEGLVFDPARYVKTLGTGSSFRYLNPVFTWGERQRRVLTENFAGQSLKTAVTGNPRFDLLRKPFRDLFRNDGDRIRERYGKMLLINSNFAFGNFSHFYNMGIVDYARKVGFITTPEDEAYVKRRAEYYSVLYQHYVKTIGAIAESFPDLAIVVRPHPSEEISTWLRDLNGFGNVRVIAEGNVLNWIMSAEAVMHTGCTTGIEAFLMDKPVLRYHPVYDEELEIPLPNSFGEPFAEPDSLIDRIGELCLQGCGQEKDPAQVALLEDYAVNSTGAFAFERILDVLDETEYGAGLESNRFSLDVSDTFPSYLKRRKTALARRIQATPGAGFLGGRKLEKIASSTEKFPELTKGMIRERLNAIREVFPSFGSNDAAIREVDRDTFVLAPS